MKRADQRVERYCRKCRANQTHLAIRVHPIGHVFFTAFTIGFWPAYWARAAYRCTVCGNRNSRAVDALRPAAVLTPDEVAAKQYSCRLCRKLNSILEIECLQCAAPRPPMPPQGPPD
jgi:hypothetical protein